MRHGPSLPALRAHDAIHDRLESPADRLLRHAGARSTYVVLPPLALANAGLSTTAGVAHGHELLMLALAAGLVVGKLLGIVSGCVLAVRVGVAVKAEVFSWVQLTGAGALGGIVSPFIAGQALPRKSDFMAAKLAVLGASVVSAVIGIAVEWSAGRPVNTDEDIVQRAPRHSCVFGCESAPNFARLNSPRS